MADEKDQTANADKAQNEADKLRMQAEEARVKMEESKKTPEQRKTEELAAKADDARAKAENLRREGGADGDTSVADAHVLVPMGTDPEMPAGDYRAVKRGNDPSNPKYAPGVSTADEEQTVKLSRVSRDSKEPVYTWVHPDMVGDYLRAGWGRD